MRLRTRILLATLVLAAAGLTLNTIAVNSETKVASAEPGARLIDLPGAQIQVRDEGNRHRQPLVLIHGYASTLHWWDRLVPLLKRRYRIVRMDLLGHGGSDKPRSGYSIEHQADLVAGVLNALHVQSAVILGHSMGGAVATSLAQRHSELVDRVLVLDEGANGKHDNFGLLSRLSYVPVLGQLMKRLATDGTIRSGYEQAFAKGFPVPDFVVPGFKRMTFSSYKGAYDDEHAFLRKEPLDQRMIAAGVPLMVVFGDADRLIKPVALEDWKGVPGVRTATIHGAGHSAMVEKPGQVAALLNEFAADAQD